MTTKYSEAFNGFSKLTRGERFERLVKMGALSVDDVVYLENGGLQDPILAENLIENVIGYFQLPLGVAANLRIDGVDVAVPMAVEETSIIAAVSKTAKWIREHGEIRTEMRGSVCIGQIQLSEVSDFEKSSACLTLNKAFLMDGANRHVAGSMVTRGGGVRDLEIRRIDRPDGKVMMVIHILADTCDAMGANILNQICEYLKAPIEQLTGDKVTMCILSNLNDRKLAYAHVVIKQIDPNLGRRIAEASLFASLDPYRAATHNKGVLNGIDPIVIATGNDWRAVEAGIHAYAARDGQYRSVTRWWTVDGDLHGEFEAPITVGTVGGVTKLHPTAKLCLDMIGVEHADKLARIMAAVSLVQNLGALTALSTVGIIQGHMKLHIANLALSAGANESERPLLHQKLEEFLTQHQRITLSNAVDSLRQLRAEMK